MSDIPNGFCFFDDGPLKGRVRWLPPRDVVEIDGTSYRWTHMTEGPWRHHYEEQT